MELSGGNKSKAAELLGMNLRFIRYRLSKQDEAGGVNKIMYKIFTNST